MSDDTPEPPEASMTHDRDWDEHTPEEPDWLVDQRAEAARHAADNDDWWDDPYELDASLAKPSEYKAPLVAVPDDDGQDHTSWWPVNLAQLFAGDHKPPEPTICERTDGQPLLYPGKCHAFNGESESGKTWAALIACVQVIRAGGHVLYLDFEDTASTVVSRLLALGAKPDDVVARFHYMEPAEPIVVRGGRYTPANSDLVSVMEHWPITLSVIDGVTEAMTMHGLKLEDNADYATFHGALPRRLASSGAAVVQIDHVTKDRENRGRWAIGAQHKLAAMDGAVFSFNVARPFGLGRHGIAKMSIEKDRPGQLRQHAKGKRVADLHLESDPTTHALAWRIEQADTEGEQPEGFKHTRYMERVSRFLEANPRGMTKSAIRQGVSGGNDEIDLAIDLLAGGWLKVTKDGQRHLHTIVVPYREGDKKPEAVA